MASRATGRPFARASIATTAAAVRASKTTGLSPQVIANGPNTSIRYMAHSIVRHFPAARLPCHGVVTAGR